MNDDDDWCDLCDGILLVGDTRSSYFSISGCSYIGSRNSLAKWDFRPSGDLLLPDTGFWRQRSHCMTICEGYN